MKKYVFIDGLPGVGKTTIINELKKINNSSIYVVDEIINETIINNTSMSEQDFINNENMKLNKYSDGLIILDRGPISSISYAQAKKIVNPEMTSNLTVDWFTAIINNISDYKEIYITNKEVRFTITSDDPKSPYGSENNQKVLEAISIYNCKKYCKNLKIINYDCKKDDINEVINEIIN